jgi:energy-coupling factor transporter ATP-binding protein EcfA2
LGSLVQVDGKIVHQGVDTGRSSGSGKTTALNAMDFLLGLNDVPNGVLQSRLTKETITVEGTFDFDGVPLTIQRGKKLRIDLNGVVTEGSSKLTEEKLDEILGMPRDLFRKILHKRQGEGGFFLNMGPSEVHKFLTSCLGLQDEQKKIDALDVRLSALQTTENLALNAVENHKTGLQATQESVVILGPPPVAEVTPEVVGELEIKYGECSYNTETAKKLHQKEMSDLEATRPQVESLPFDRTNIEQLEKEIGTVLAKITDLQLAELGRQSEAKSKISVLRIDINKLEAAEIVRQTAAKDRISELFRERTRLSDVERNRQVAVQTQIHNAKLKILQEKGVVDAGTIAKEEASQFMKELDKIKASLCPTCEQGWVTDAARAKESSILLKLKDCRSAVTAASQAAERVVVWEYELQRLQLELQPKQLLEVDSLDIQIQQLKTESQPRIVPEAEEIESRINRLKMDTAPREIAEVVELNGIVATKNVMLTAWRHAEGEHQASENLRIQGVLSMFTEKQNTLRDSQEAVVKTLREYESRALSAYDSSVQKLKSFEESSKRHQDSLKKLEVQLDGYKKQLSDKSRELDAIQDEIKVVMESKKAVKSYLSCSFEDALDSIGDMATRLIRSIPNMSTATVQLEGLKETKEGKIKEEVTCLLSMDGEIGIPVKSLSGGERSSVDIGIDLSVIKFIEERTGKGIDLYILDEPFLGLDTVCIEDAIEMLRNCSVDKRLFLVEHNPVIAQSIENRIVVVRDGLTSNIIQQ